MTVNRVASSIDGPSSDFVLPDEPMLLANVDGDGGNNTLTGGAGDDSIRGFGGDDVLEGAAGNDTLDGGSGSDTASYAGAGSGVTVSLALAGAQNTGGAGTDTLIAIEQLMGSAFGDQLSGASGNAVFETFQGLAGDDTIDGGVVTDLVNFLDGNRLVFWSSPSGVTVDFEHDTVEDGFGGTDSVFNFNFAWGTNHDDSFLGSSSNEFEAFMGRGGDDTLNGGGGGFTRAEYTDSPDAVTVDLLDGSASDGYGGTDELIDIRGVRGSAFADSLYGASQADEQFEGRAGNDRIDGRDGFDLIRFDAAGSGIVVQLNGAAAGSATDGQGGTDTLFNVEGVRGTGFGDSLSGSSALVFEQFDGRAGNDSINGGAYADTHFYDDQNEAFYGASPSAVTVSLAAGTAQDGHGGTDTLQNINAVRGSSFADSIVGSSNAIFERFTGGAGNDTIHGGAITNRVAWDGNGLDYTFAPNSVVVDFIAGSASQDGQGGVDTFTDINWVRGSGANDTLRGSNDAVLIEQFRGSHGDDLIDGRGGFDIASYQNAVNAVTVNLNTGRSSGDHGNDTLVGIEAVRGSMAADTIIGSNLNGAAFVDGSWLEVLEGLEGNDTINGGAGTLDLAGYNRSRAAVTVTLTGSGAGTASDGLGGTDKLTGIEGALGSIYGDTFNGSGSATLEIFEGHAGNDTIDGNGGKDQASYWRSYAAVNVNLATGLANNDGFGNVDTLIQVEDVFGSYFNDVIVGDALGNRLDGGEGGNDRLTGGAGNDTLAGVGGNDTLVGGDGNDSMEGGLGADNMNGGAGSDRYDVDNAGDVVTEAAGGGTDIALTRVNYTLAANVENGQIVGTGTIRLTGNELANVLTAGAGSNVINGGGGLDTVSYATAGAAVKINLGVTSAQATGGSSSDTLLSIERATGSRYNDSLTGSAGSNVLDGALGNDTVSGGAGNDVLIGGGGNDRLTGGAGLDTFRFVSTLSASSNVDAVTDFVAADDGFALARAIFAQAGPAGTLAAAAFRVGVNAGDASDRIIYDKAAGKLYYDADGTGAIAKVLFATVVPNTTLTAVDFQLI